MPTRGLTLRGAPRASASASGSLPLLTLVSISTPRGPSKEDLARVPLRDLALEAQYAEIREALGRYKDEAPAEPQGGEVKCGRCGTICAEDAPVCGCGNFLHFHRIFTCPDCATQVEREARDCNRCGSRFWSPVNPPFGEITDRMVSEYLERVQES
jgi:hypothetical protein